MEAKNVRRRLAAILAADVAGYSRLMGADEEGTLRRLQAHRRDLVDPKVREHKGRIVKTTGDGMLIEFASVVDAVRCAVEVQRGMIDREAGVSPEQELRFRIGINLGDIVIEKDDIFGDGVNVAARLEALAEPGGLCLSGIVHDQIRGKLSYSFADRGEQSVKNIARPVPVFAMGAAAVGETPLVAAKPPARFDINRGGVLAIVLLVLLGGVGVAAWRLGPYGPSETKPAPRLSVVVLPFANLSNDPDQEYFADAITDNLTTDLTRIVDSFVISRTTAFTFKGKPVDVKQIGRDLGVRYVLEGSVRRLGEQVQVNAQLIDAESGAHVWADQIDAERNNLAKAQGEITSRLARTLQLKLIEAAGSQVDPTKNPDARDLIMRGWAYYYRPPTSENQQESLTTFERALELDAQSNDAKIGIATVLEQQIAMGRVKSRAEELARAEKLATEAAERDPNSARAYFALGSLHRLANRLPQSRVELEKAVALDRNHAGAVLQLGITLLYLGEPEAALPNLERALHLSPGALNVYFFYVWLGLDHLLMGHAEQAVDFFRKAIAAAPRRPPNHLLLAAALGFAGEIDEARQELAEARRSMPMASSLKKLLEGPEWREPGSPKFFALRKQTVEVGFLKAGMPEE